MKTPKKKQPVKARKIRGIQIDHTRIDMDTRYFVLPATQEAYDAMCEQAHAAVVAEFTSKKGPPGLKDYSDAVLKSLNITPPTK